MRAWFALLFVLQATSTTLSAVLPAVTSLTTEQVNSFNPYGFFAAAAYCSPRTTINWSCGERCNGNPGFIPIASGGNGDTEQFWYVGYTPDLNEVIVAHQGTDLSKLFAILSDVELLFVPLARNQTLFPGLPFDILVHSGFAAAHARVANEVLPAVRRTMTRFNTNKVSMVGHSLGAALALLDAIFLPLHLPLNTSFKLVGYGMLRVGNVPFSQYLDSRFPNLTRINNKKDPAPGFPDRLLGFQHPHGEIHITDDEVWHECSGDENPSSLCTRGSALSLLNIPIGGFANHFGPYNGVLMGATQC